jgi:hypothetical protein
VDGGDLAAVGVLVNADAGHEVAIAQAHLPAGCQAEELLRRILHEVVALDPQLSGERHLAHAGALVLRVVDRVHVLGLASGVVVEDHLQRVQHRHHPQRVLVEVLAEVVLQQLDLVHAVHLGDTDLVTEAADGSGCVAAPAHPDDGRQPRVVPTGHDTLLDQLQQLALAHQRVGEVQPGELDLLRVVDAELVEEPVVERPVVLELQRADRVGNALDRVALAVGPVVHRVDAPLVTGAVVGLVADAVHHRVPHVHVVVGQVDLRPQHMLAVLELTGPHAREQVQALLDPTVAVGAGLSRRKDGAAILGDLVGGVAVHVGVTLLDELHRPVIELVKVV